MIIAGAQSRAIEARSTSIGGAKASPNNLGNMNSDRSVGASPANSGNRRWNSAIPSFCVSPHGATLRPAAARPLAGITPGRNEDIIAAVEKRLRQWHDRIDMTPPGDGGDEYPHVPIVACHVWFVRFPRRRGGTSCWRR